MSKKKMSLKELDFNNIGSWPREFQVGFCVVLGLFLLFFMYWFMTRPKLSELETLEADEVTRRQEFEKLQGQAANLEPLKQQLQQMEQQLQQVLRQLPSKTEMPDLIVDISQTALATGITNELFQPGDETSREFYAERPIELRMAGTYHQFGAFISGVASLPRVVIMTMHDIQLTPRDGSQPAAPGDKKKQPVAIGPDTILELKGTVKTYRYRDEDESSGGSASGGTKGGAGAGGPNVPGAGAAATAASKTGDAVNAAGGGSH